MLLAWMGAALIGLTLGMLGSGGSILTVPILIYLAGEPDKIAIAESLAIVGLISLAGAIAYAWQELVHWRSVLLFGLPGMIGTYLGAYLSQWLRGGVQLGIFAMIMLLAAYFMTRPPKHKLPSPAYWQIALGGFSVGGITGLVGVGGGFLIVPALALLGQLPMNLAIGTSLAIITLNTGSGFYKYLHLLPQYGYAVHWNLVLLFAVLGILGGLLGNRIAVRLPQYALRRGFAGFLVLMGVIILWQNLTKVLQ